MLCYVRYIILYTHCVSPEAVKLPVMATVSSDLKCDSIKCYRMCREIEFPLLVFFINYIEKVQSCVSHFKSPRR